MANTRGLGYVPNLAHERAVIPHVNRLLGLPPSLPGSASLEEFVAVRDQATTSSCVGQADAQAARVRLLKTGVDCPLLSALSIYAPARSEDRVQRGDPLSDDGCRPAQAVRAIRALGIATEEAWPFDEAVVDFDVPLDVLEDANKLLPYTIDGEYSLGDALPDRSRLLRLALSQGYPVVFGTELDASFFDVSGTQVVGPATGTVVGGHMMCAVGYETLPSGVVVFRVCNSWGVAWGDRGLFNASEAFFADPRCGDLSAFTMKERA